MQRQHATPVQLYYFRDPDSPGVEDDKSLSREREPGEGSRAKEDSRQDRTPEVYDKLDNSPPVELDSESAIEEGDASRKTVHQSGPLPQFYRFDIPPQNLNKLEPLGYYPLNPDVDPIRLLVILPHFGNPYSTVQCNLFPVSLQEHHYCFAAIQQTRGNKNLKSSIVVNCQFLQITRNLEVFLRHFRREQHAIMVWIREICIHPDDFQVHQAAEWRDRVMNKACKTRNMPDFMETLQKTGVLDREKYFTVREKDWSKFIRSAAPTHFPIPLRTFTKEELKRDEKALTRVLHQYVPLDLVAQEIRLIVLLPAASRGDALYAHFAHESLFGNVVYQCLSYTWGNGEATSELTLNGQLFLIRKNLEDALRALRSVSDRTTLWIDAICINQENVQERSGQVARMHQIYEKADRVLVWLGEADEDSDLALDFIAGVREYNATENPLDQFGWDKGEAKLPAPFVYFDHEWDPADLQEDSESLSIESTQISSLSSLDKSKGRQQDQFQGLDWAGVEASPTVARCWAAIYRLLQRPYFRRMWVVQEIAAASLPTVWCGNRRIAWEDLHTASSYLMTDYDNASKMWKDFGIDFDWRKGKEIFDGTKCLDVKHPSFDITSTHRFSYLRQMSLLNKPLSFLFLALLHRESECTDPRDKIYALWNLAKDAEGLGMVPNYSLSVRELYIAFAKQHILHHKCLDIICAPQVKCIAAPEGGLPSWVPDWRTMSHTSGYIRPENLPIVDVDELTDLDAPLYHAARLTKVSVEFFEDDELLVCGGMLIDEISSISPATGNINDWLQIALEKCHHGGDETAKEKISRDLCSMIMGDETSSWEYDPVKGSRPLPTLDRTKAKKTAQISYDRRNITPNIKGRQLVVTKRGYMGLAPHWGELGDTLAILFGCNVPVLLSSCSESSTHFHLKGDCFVQGWMRGELLDSMGGTDEEIVKLVMNDHLAIQIR